MKVRGLILALLLVAAPVAAQDVIPDLRASRAALPTPMSQQQISDMLSRVASQHPGWGMLRKDAGNRCPTPYAGISISCDWMVYAPTRWGYDILRDQEGSGEIATSDGTALSPGQEVVFPWPTSQPSPTPTQNPSPTPAPSLDLSGFYFRLDSLVSLRQQDRDALERMFADYVNRDNRAAAEHAAILSQVKEVKEKPGALESTFGNRYVQIALGIIGALTAQQAIK